MLQIKLNGNDATIETVVEYAQRKGIRLSSAENTFMALYHAGQARLYWLAWFEGEDYDAPPLAVRPFHGEVYPPLQGVEFMLGAVMLETPDRRHSANMRHFPIRPFNVELHRPEVE